VILIVFDVLLFFLWMAFQLNQSFQKSIGPRTARKMGHLQKKTRARKTGWFMLEECRQTGKKALFWANLRH
jgi:hypothetical protein